VQGAAGSRQQAAGKRIILPHNVYALIYQIQPNAPMRLGPVVVYRPYYNSSHPEHTICNTSTPNPPPAPAKSNEVVFGFTFVEFGFHPCGV
jgi:pectate lyase